jgi:hypothetical protein
MHDDADVGQWMARYGLIEVAQIHMTGELLYQCIECDTCWDSPDATTQENASGLLRERYPDLKWWQLAPVTA